MKPDFDSHVFAFNPHELRAIGVWWSYTNWGWYVSEFEFNLVDRCWDETNGAFWTIEEDDDGNIIEGYGDAIEAYEQEHALDGDCEITESLFNEIFKAAFEASRKRRSNDAVQD